jgi:cytoskeletal protein RodZ
VVTPAELGEKLRRQRERRGVSLDRIADTTKIGRRLLVSLEVGDCSRWPAGLYSRAYVRLYAQAVGLDAEELVDEFAECFPRIAWPEGRLQAPVAVEHTPSSFAPRAGRVASRRLAGDTV